MAKTPLSQAVAVGLVFALSGPALAQDNGPPDCPTAGFAAPNPGQFKQNIVDILGAAFGKKNRGQWNRDVAQDVLGGQPGFGQGDAQQGILAQCGGGIGNPDLAPD